MEINQFSEALEELQRERGIPREALIEAVKASLLSAAKKKFKEEENLEVRMSPDGEFRIILKKEGEKEEDITPADFGRLAAQTAKQVIIQRLREAEKEEAYAEFSHKEGELVTGIVQHRETMGYLVNLGRMETILAYQETIPGENFRPRDRVKLYIVETKKTSRGPLVIVSRAHPNLIRKLFEMEVPEIKEGILEIKVLAREAGRRSKVAILSHDKNVGAVGTCIGQMGARIQNIVKELGQERVDVVEWSKDPATFIAHALNPAKSGKVELNEKEMSAKVTVPEKELSLAIGKEGQNVRLAVKLTGWKIDIVPEEGTEVSEAARKRTTVKTKKTGVKTKKK